MSTDENDIVLDPFVGTGTTVIAGKRLGRRFIGIDVDEKYVNITTNKLSKELPDSKLGDIWVSFYLNEVVTIRNKDWDKLAPYFSVPENVKDVDFAKIKLNKTNPDTLGKTGKDHKIDRDLFDSELAGL
jgi:site-specific DNA-methyltransferase (adenine-specific)